MNYHILINNQTYGPYPFLTVQQMLTSGQITYETLVWYPGLPNWVPLISLYRAPIPSPVPMRAAVNG